jgi:hypothetical protein
LSTPGGEPSEEELRAAYEAELSRITSVEMVIQSAVSLLNVGGRRLGLAAGAEGQRDLEQVRDAIDGVRGLLPVLERRLPAQELGPLRDALSQLQMAYARESQAGAAAAQEGGASQAKPAEAEPESKPEGPGPAESSGRLWVPGR